MNRFHVHLNVVDLDASIRFCNELFATAPTVQPKAQAGGVCCTPAPGCC